VNRTLLLVVLAALSALPLAAQPPAPPLSVADLFAHGPLAGTPPSGLSWSPDGAHLTYIDGGELFELDPPTPSAQLRPRVLVSRAKLASLSGAAGSETDLDHRDRYKLASYLWAPDSAHLLFDVNGSLWLYDPRLGTGAKIGASAAASGDDPKFSPNGDLLSFVDGNRLSVVRLANHVASPVVVAAAPNPAILNGAVDWVYEEELDVRSNYFWSPDSRHIAYLQTNEAAIPEYPLTDWIPTHAAVNRQRYPQPGDPNPDARIGVVGAEGGKTVWINLPILSGQDYIPRFGWADSKTLWIEVVTRDHKHRDLFFADAAKGYAHPALQLTDDKFFDESYDVSVGQGSIVLTNWSDGHNHLYLYSYDQSNPGAATLVRQLTHGDYEVGEVLRVDHAAKLVDFAANDGNPLEQKLWEVNFAGLRRHLSTGAGNHVGNVSPAGTAFVDQQSSRLDPPTFRLCAAADQCAVFWQSHALEPYHLRAPQQFEVKAHDGTVLYATLLLPEGAVTPASVPLIVNPYGGPGAQRVTNSWTDEKILFDEILAQHGFAVLHTDNRGMAMRGRAFAQAAYHNFGPVQFEDQLTVLDAALASYPQLDPKRLGWWGWSWGGTFTLYALSHSDRFRAGVSVAPVTDWRDYDSIYTERYLGLPADDQSSYKDFSVVNSAASLKGHLLLVHGTGDDNVHLENSIQYLQKLIEANLPYDLQLYPRKTHSISGPEARIHLYSRILAHFEQYLKGSATESGL